MIQDIGQHKIDTDYMQNAVPDKGDYVIGFKNNIVYLKKGEGCNFLTFKDLLPVSYVKEAFEKYKKEATFLMKLDGRPLYLLPDKYLERCPMASQEEYSVFRTKQPKENAFAMITAYHLYFWYQHTRFCGACGVRMRKSKNERAMVCPICDNVVYPRISPAIIVGVVNKDKILLTKYAQGYRNYALIAGFCEIGETIEETVQREVMEETGVRVKNIRYYKSQPWAPSQSLLSGYFAQLDGNDEIHMDENELSVAKWVAREDLEGKVDLEISLTAEMIEYFRTHEELQ